MATINTHIKAQYDAERIKNTDIAAIYVGVVPTVLTESMKFALQKQNQEKQYDVLTAQEELYQRQKESFDDNKYQKVLEAQLNYNSMVFQDADAPDVLNVTLEQAVNDIYNKITGKDTNLNIVPEV